MSEFPSAPNYGSDTFLKVHATPGANSVELQVRGSGIGHQVYALSDATLRLLLVAELPGGGRAALGVVGSPYALTVPRASLPTGGWVNFTGEVVAGTVGHRFVANPYHLGSGSSAVPVKSMRLLSAQYDAGCVDWLPPPSRYPASTAAPYALKPGPSQKGVAPARWVREAPWGPSRVYPESIARWRRIGGQVQVERLYEIIEGSGTKIGAVIDSRPYFPTYGGPRGIANTTPYATVRGHPSGGRGPQWIELDGYGRFWGYNRDGSITGMGGFRMPADVYEIPDETLSTWRTVGSFPDGALKHPHDFAYDYIDRKYLYVADTDNHRLVRVSRHSATAASPEDFSKWVFQAWADAFSSPTSIDSTPNGAIFVVDAHGLWSVDRATGKKAPLLARTKLFWCRALSSGHVCVTDTEGQVFRVNPQTKQSALLAQVTFNNQPFASDWPVVSPDVGGHVGPVDSLYYVNGANYLVWRIDQDGQVHGPNYFAGGSGSTNVGELKYCQDGPGHYMWNAEVHQEEPYVLTRGFGNAAPVLIRPMKTGEDHLGTYDSAMVVLGLGVMQRGTVEGFPWGSRPSFLSLFTIHGNTGLGLKMFDEIQALPLAQRIAFLQSGMGGGVKRPELVGNPLRGLLYWIWRNSPQFLQGQPADLPPLETDQAMPVISNVTASRSGAQVTWRWTTDRPTLGYVRYGDRSPLHRWSALETGFSTSHTVSAGPVDGAVLFQICSLGANGVIRLSALGNSDGSVDTVAPKAPTGLRTE